MFKLDRIDHVALTVADVDRSVAWYRDVLGLERRHEETWGSYPAVMYAGPTGVALFPARAPDLPPAPDHARTAIMRHLAFQTDHLNFVRAQAELKQRGIAFSVEDHGISRSICFHDPHGYEIEITTYELKVPVERCSGELRSQAAAGTGETLEPKINGSQAEHAIGLQVGHGRDRAGRCAAHDPNAESPWATTLRQRECGGGRSKPEFLPGKLGLSSVDTISAAL